MEGVALWQVALIGALVLGFFAISWGIQLWSAVQDRRRPSPKEQEAGAFRSKGLVRK